MVGAAVWSGLTGSGFLADVTDRDRDPARIAATLIGGVFVGFVAAFACWILVLVPYTVITGLGGDGFKDLARTAEMFQNPDVGGLSLTLLRLLESTATDGIFPVAFVALAALLAGHPFHHYLTMASKVRVRLMFAGLGLAALAMAPLILTERLLAPAGQMLPIAQVAPHWSGRMAYALSALLLIPAAGAEELMFRGWLLRQAAAFTRKPAALIGFTAIMFSAAHFDFAPGAFLTRTLMGAGFAYMTLRLGGIEFSTGAHAANNILIVLFIEPLTFQPPAASSELSGAAFVEDVVLVAGYVLITEAVVRIAALRRWTGLAPDEIAPHALEAAGLP